MLAVGPGLRNSLRTLRALRSDSRSQSDVEAGLRPPAPRLRFSAAHNAPPTRPTPTSGSGGCGVARQGAWFPACLAGNDYGERQLADFFNLCSLCAHHCARSSGVAGGWWGGDLAGGEERRPWGGCADRRTSISNSARLSERSFAGQSAVSSAPPPQGRAPQRSPHSGPPAQETPHHPPAAPRQPNLMRGCAPRHCGCVRRRVRLHR